MISPAPPSRTAPAPDASGKTAPDSSEATAEDASLVEQDLLVEEISIDGMCGVY